MLQWICISKQHIVQLKLIYVSVIVKVEGKKVLGRVVTNTAECMQPQGKQKQRYTWNGENSPVPIDYSRETETLEM